jgi:hypothetical protein
MTNHLRHRFGLAVLACLHAAAPSCADEPRDWVEPTKQVHARFAGRPGTFAQFGDSITVTMAYWAPLQNDPKGLDKETARAYQTVKAYMRPECWRDWKGPDHGSTGSMTIRWADENVDRWLKRLNPEVALIMFGTNDLGQLERKEYSDKTRSVVRRCLANGTIVILSTIPPRSGLVEKSREFAETVREIAKDLHVPLVDYQEAVLNRRPNDWGGTLAKFKDSMGDEYQVPTLIARDGVHPSFPAKYRDFSEESLNHNGYQLRTYLTLGSYAAVVGAVLQPR